MNAAVADRDDDAMQMLGKPLARGGDATHGYEVCVDRTLRLMHWRVWGFWQLPLGESFRNATIAGMQVMAAGGPWFLLADIRDYPPQHEAVQRCHAEVMSAAAKLKLVRAANQVESAHSNMQLRRLYSESGLEFGFFIDESEALAWLGSGSK